MRPGRALARPLQYRQITLLPGIQTSSTKGLANFDLLAARGASRFAPGSPCCHTLHRSDLRDQCATLTPHWYKTSGNPLETVQSARDLILSIATALVDRQDAVQIDVAPDSEGVIFRLKVAPEDLGKVIGKQGRTARAIRTILAASSMKAQVRFALDIQELVRC